LAYAAFYRLFTFSMNIHQRDILQDDAVLEPLVAWKRHQRAPNPARYIFFGVLGTVVAISAPILLVLPGIGMSRQEVDVASNGALASLLAIIFSFVAIRRLLGFPLLRTYGYIAITFVSSFAIMAIGLKFFRIDFSSPQFFLGMAIIAAQVEIFFYVHHNGAPLHIAVIPGATTLATPPRTLPRSIIFTRLSSVPMAFDYNGVVADFSAELEPEWEHFLAFSALQGIPVYHVKQFNESITGRVAVDHLWENTLGALVPALIYPQFKRAIDFFGALLFLPVVVLVVGVCAIIIKLETPGPIFYQQRRTGTGGRPFTIFKLRTMTHKHDGSAYTLQDDKRVTQVGRFLRQYRIDELPQVINILRGDMSWIGPRPEVISLAEWYEREVPFYVYRHIVRPGITGWAQVHQGNVAAVDAARVKLEYDFFYIKHFSFWLDAVIVAKTLLTIVTGFGSR
jgi:lipopolysaccharide/colanic/teichoic acid biosynthesis glycosyltransferase/fumarate reductase subunit D